MTSNNAERRQRIKEQSKEVANYLNKQPSDELIQQWMDEFYGGTGAFASTEETFMAKRAAEWGADQELEACIKLLSDLGGDGEMIRRYRRPKPPSLKEQAKFAAAVLRSPDETCSIAELQQHWHTICNALEQLND